MDLALADLLIATFFSGMFTALVITSILYWTKGPLIFSIIMLSINVAFALSQLLPMLHA